MITIELSDEEYLFCQHLANLRTSLQFSGNDPSIGYTTYSDQRGSNNLMGQVAEYSTLKLLYESNIAFSGVCFTITFIYQNQGVLPPLFDFLLADGSSVDVKADRYEIDKLGVIVPNEKLKYIHLADFTLWLKYDETKGKKVIFYGWNTREDLLELRKSPNAVRPNGSPMPKPCKRLTKEKWRDINEFIDIARSKTTSEKLTISFERLGKTLDFRGFIDENTFTSDKDKNWLSNITQNYLDSLRPVKISLIPVALKNNKIAVTVICQNLENPFLAVSTMVILDSNKSISAFYMAITSSISKWLTSIQNINP